MPRNEKETNESNQSKAADAYLRMWPKFGVRYSHGGMLIEKDQAYGKKAKQATSALVLGKKVILQTHGLDNYWRTITDVSLPDGVNRCKRLVGELIEFNLRRAYLVNLIISVGPRIGKSHTACLLNPSLQASRISVTIKDSNRAQDLCV
jgi:nuclease-like protein